MQSYLVEKIQDWLTFFHDYLLRHFATRSLAGISLASRLSAFVSTKMKFTSIIVSEWSQTRKTPYLVVPSIRQSQRGSITGNDKQSHGCMRLGLRGGGVFIKYKRKQGLLWRIEVFYILSIPVIMQKKRLNVLIHFSRELSSLAAHMAGRPSLHLALPSNLASYFLVMFVHVSSKDFTVCLCALIGCASCGGDGFASRLCGWLSLPSWVSLSPHLLFFLFLFLLSF